MGFVFGILIGMISGASLILAAVVVREDEREKDDAKKT
jgi:hypothetical protein